MSKAAFFKDNPLVVPAVILALIVFVFPLAVRFPLLDPDEGLHASIAQEMVERGDWLVPHFLGQPFFDKPILYFWCQALSLKLFGMNEPAVRLPGLLFGLLGAITTGLLGRRLFGRTTGWISGIFYATMILPVAMAQVASHDVVLVPCINLALLFLWESDTTNTAQHRWSLIAAAGLLLGLSILAKGLVGVALVGVTYGSYVLIIRRFSLAIFFHGVAVLILAALLASAWFVAVELKHTGFLHYFFIERHLLGFVTSTQMHGEAPWWYYLPIILGGGLPWIGYIPVTISDQRERKKLEEHIPSNHRPLTLLIVWLVSCTLLLSISHSKLATYIWPVFPAVAILAAVGWARLLDCTLQENAKRSLLRSFHFSSLTGPVVLPLAIFVIQKIFKIHIPWPVWVVTCVVGLAALVPLRYMKKRRWSAMLTASTLSTAAQFVVILMFILPQAAENFTACRLADYFNNQKHLPVRLLIAEERLGSLIFYLDPALRSNLKDHQIDMVFYDQSTEMPPGTIITLPERRAFNAERYKELAGLSYKNVGRYRLYEIGKRD